MRSIKISILDDLQHGLIEARPGRRAIGQRRRSHLHIGLTETPLDRPQVGWMNALCTRQCLYVAVLGKQGHRGNSLARQDAFEVLAQRKTGPLQGTCCVVSAQLRALDEFLNGRLHGPEYERRRRQPHHLQRATGLVQLLAGNPQGAHIQRRKIRLARQIGIVHEAAQRLDGTVQRLAQFLQHPCQRP